MALIFSWNIKKICIYPFGGYTIFNDCINKPFIEEFLVFLGGILFQTIFFIIFILVVDNNTYIYKIFTSYNITILIFNMIPIMPLDGAKVLNIAINYLYPFKKSHKISIYVSYVFLTILVIFEYNNLNMILMIFILLFMLIKEHKNHLYIFNAFLLERYLKKNKYKKKKIIYSLNVTKTMKYFKNIFVSKDRYYDEYEILKNRYKNY